MTENRNLGHRDLLPLKEMNGWKGVGDGDVCEGEETIWLNAEVESVTPSGFNLHYCALLIIFCVKLLCSL